MFRTLDRFFLFCCNENSNYWTIVCQLITRGCPFYTNNYVARERERARIFCSLVLFRYHDVNGDVTFFDSE